MDLFPEAKDSRPTTWIDLDRDSSIWDDFITQQVKKVIKGRAASIVISWSRKEDKKGAGIGSVIVRNTNDESRFFIVPVIIKDYRLAPMDVMMIPGGGIDTFDEKNAERFLFSGAIGKEVSDRPWRLASTENQNELFSDMIGAGITSQPFMGYENTTSTYQKSSSILTQVLPYADEEDIKNILKSLEDPTTLYKFSGDKKLLVDIFKNSVGGKKREKKEVQVVQKVGPDSYVMMANSLEHFKPVIDIVGTSELIDFTKNTKMPSEFIKEVEDAGDAGVVIDWSTTRKGPVLEEPKRIEKFTKVTEPGLYGVYTKEGFVNCVLTNRSYSPVSEHISVSTWHMISNSGGGPQSGDVYAKSVRTVELDDREPLAGDYGYFIYTDTEKEEDPVVVGPYEILSVSYNMTSDGLFEHPMQNITLNGENKTIWTSSRLTVRTPEMKKIQIGFSNDILGFAEISAKTSIGNVHIFPTKNAAWIPMRGVLDIKKPPADIEKTASIQYDGMFYEINGLDGLPNEWRTIESDAKMAFVMRCCDMGIEKIAECLTNVKNKKRINVPMSLKSRELKKEASNVQFLDKSEKRQLAKLASYFDDMATVDSILSLNFVNTDNVDKFTQSLDKFISTKEELLRLLLISRLGNIEVPESILKQCIDVLGKVIDGLRRLKAKK